MKLTYVAWCSVFCISSLIANTEIVDQIQVLQQQGNTKLQAYFSVGTKFFHEKEFEKALYCFKKAQELNPNAAQPYFNMGLALKYTDNLEEAADAFLHATERKPTYTKAHFNRAVILKQLNKYDEAIAAYKEVIKQDPHHTQAHKDLGELYRTKNNNEKAIEHFCIYLKLNPRDYTTRFNLAFLCTSLGLVDEAVAQYKIIAKQTNSAQAWYNIGYTLKMAGRLDESIEMYKKVLEVNPAYEPAHLALGFAYLNNGDFARGWKQHERYLKSSNKNADRLRGLLQTNSIAGKRILLRPEGGLGDTIQFFRYAQVLKEMGAHVIASVQKPLVSLLSHCPFVDELIHSGQAVEPYHASCTFMSLPAVFHSDEETTPQNIPYIHPDPVLSSYWGDYFEQTKTFNIGICWQADVHNDVSRLPVAHRGIPLEKLLPLTEIENVHFYSLQKKDGVEQLADVPDDTPLHVFDDTFDELHGPFTDTAAAMQHLDLIITVDTAIAHLAGALGRPVWLLLPYSTDWRWVAGKTTSHWYPTMRIFKQPHPFDWDTVVDTMFVTLQKKIEGYTCAH